MRYAIISDVHGNIEALNAVMNEIDFYQPDKTICLGDVIGYGPNPEECAKTIIAKCDFCLIGNHEAAVNGIIDCHNFTKFAKESINWTKNNVSNSLKAWINELKFVEKIDDVIFSHASLVNSTMFNYIQTIEDAKTNFNLMKTNLMFCGHSHQPIILIDGNPITFSKKNEFNIDKNHKTIINVGSVGQPRDENNKACFVIYDDIEQAVYYNRVSYDIEQTMNKMKKCGFSEHLVNRLMIGK